MFRNRIFYVMLTCLCLFALVTTLWNIVSLGGGKKTNTIETQQKCHSQRQHLSVQRGYGKIYAAIEVGSLCTNVLLTLYEEEMAPYNVWLHNVVMKRLADQADLMLRCVWGSVMEKMHAMKIPALPLELWSTNERERLKEKFARWYLNRFLENKDFSEDDKFRNDLVQWLVTTQDKIQHTLFTWTKGRRLLAEYSTKEEEYSFTSSATQSSLEQEDEKTESSFSSWRTQPSLEKKDEKTTILDTMLYIAEGLGVVILYVAMVAMVGLIFYKLYRDRLPRSSTSTPSRESSSKSSIQSSERRSVAQESDFNQELEPDSPSGLRQERPRVN